MRIVRNRGITFKLIALIFAGSMLVFALIMGMDYMVSRQIVLEKVKSNAHYLTEATLNRIQIVLASIESATRNQTQYVEWERGTREDLLLLVRSLVEKNPEVYGSAIAFEPNVFNAASSCFAFYAYRCDEAIQTTIFDGINYQYLYKDWYQIPKELNRPVWSEPYFDEGGGDILMATYSAPFYRALAQERSLTGVLTADLSLSWLQQLVSSIRINRTGYGFLISKNGTLITHPNPDLVMNDTIFSVAEARNSPHFREIGRSMVRGERGFAPWTSIVTGKEGWLGFAPLESSGWSLGVFFPEDELMEDVSRLTRNAIFLGLAGFLVLLGVIFLVADSITKPLRELYLSTVDIAKGDLDAELPRVRSLDEVGQLTKSFRHMRRALKEHIDQLTEATAARERIESELKIAREIQMGILPKLFPPFPDEPEFDIYATIEPAKEVGGDLYDFYHLDEHHLCFVIGDVSGKGIPASLFMAVAKTLIKATALSGLDPAETLSKVNDELARDNDACMFVTVFLGILDLRTGNLEYANGGHNPPLIVPGRGEIEFLKPPGGSLVGAMEGIAFESSRMSMVPGDTLFLYTDGVTEAMNEHLELFSEERLKRDLTSLRDQPIKEMVAGIMHEVHHFSQWVEQSDDITMMAVKYWGLP